MRRSTVVALSIGGLLVAAGIAAVVLRSVSDEGGDAGPVPTATATDGATPPPPPPDGTPSPLPEPDGQAGGFQADIDAQLQSLTEGGIGYDVPREMKAGVESTVLVYITRAPRTDTGIGEEVPVPVKPVKVGPLMAVELRGRDFDIEPPGPQEQVVPPTGFSEWQWSVVPIKSGIHTLRFVVYVVLRLPDGAEKSFQVVEQRMVSVAVNVPYHLKRFLATYWPHVSGLITAIFGSGLLWTLLGRRRRRRSGRPPRRSREGTAAPRRRQARRIRSRKRARAPDHPERSDG